MTHNGLQHAGGQNRYALEIYDSPVSPDVLQFRGRERFSEPFSWKIEFTTPVANIPPEHVLMKYASLRMPGDKTVHGILTKFEHLSTSADQSHYRVTLSARMALLGYTYRSAVFQGQSAIEVVEQVLRSHGLEGPDFEFRLERTYPPRELITQWRETDLAFVQRLLSEVGVFWRTEMDDAHELDVTIFADSQLNYHLDVRLPYCEPSGLLDGEEESTWGVRTWHNVVAGSVTLSHYDYRAATTPLDATVSVRHDTPATGEHFSYNSPYHVAGDDNHSEPETESGAFYARIRHERELNQSVRIHLHSNAASLAPGQVLEPQGEGVIRALTEGVIITLASYRASRDSALRVSVWGMPYSERYCFRPPEIPRPEVSGTLPARIESRTKNDIYAHLDEHGRYRVKLDFDRDNTEQGYGYLWLRMATPHAGDELGWHAPLIDGTEVAIAYSNGDIDLPYIAYALHDSAHPDPVNRDNHTRNILKTPAGNTLQMEDKRGEEHVKLATEYGKTLLHIGHIVDEQNVARGQGFELRTDEHGTIRVAKGLFISADGQPKGVGEVLEMGVALSAIKQIQQQLKQLDMAAEQAGALSADLNSQIAMLKHRLTPLDGAIHFSAPEGMAFTSGEHLQLAADKNVAINAGGDISVGVMGNMATQVGEKLGMFARTGPLSLKSGEGPIAMQTQNGEMKLFAQQKLTIASEGDILFAGKKRITLIGGGSYLRLEAGKIEYGTVGTYMRKSARTTTAGPASLPLNMPPLADPVQLAADALVQETAGVVLRIGVFFDGTANNTANHLEGKEAIEAFLAQCEDPGEQEKLRQRCLSGEKPVATNSQGNDMTNIGKMHELYLLPDESRLTVPVYVSGIGTEDGEGDTNKGAGVDMFGTSSLAKVELACRRLIVEAMDRQLGRILPTLGPVQKIEFDVFGFSRGASAARQFVNTIDQQDNHLLVKSMAGLSALTLKAGFNWASRKHVRIRFVGLLDTVVTSQVMPRDITLAPDCADRVVHLIAKDEWRMNFASTRITDDVQGTQIAPNFTELIIPGSHSDVGGGYYSRWSVADPSTAAPVLTENKVIRSFVGYEPMGKPALHTLAFRAAWDYAQQRVRQGWAKGVEILDAPTDQPVLGHLNIRTTEGDTVMTGSLGSMGGNTAKYRSVRIDVILHRVVEGEYSRIPLHMMMEAARAAGVPFREWDASRDILKLDSATTPPPSVDLAKLDAYCVDAGKQAGVALDLTTRLPMDAYQQLRFTYLHYSADTGLVNYPNIREGEETRRVMSNQEGGH